MTDWSEIDIQRALDEGRGWLAVCDYPPGQVGGPTERHGRILTEVVEHAWAGSACGWAEFGDDVPYVQFQFVVPAGSGSAPTDFQPALQEAWDAAFGEGGQVRVDPWPGPKPGRIQRRGGEAGPGWRLLREGFGMPSGDSVSGIAAPAAQLLVEYGTSVRKGLQVGSLVHVPAGTVAVVVTPRGQVTDTLSAGSHPVQAETLPGLATALRVKFAAGAGIPGFGLPHPSRTCPRHPVVHPARRHPHQAGGLRIARVNGRVGLQVTDPTRFFPLLLDAAIRQERAGRGSSFSLTATTGPERTAFLTLPQRAGALLDLVVQSVALEELNRLQIPIDSLAGCQARLQAAAQRPLSARLEEAGMRLLQFEVDPVGGAVRTPCVRCGSETAPTGPATFRRNISHLHVRFTQQVGGNFCVPCALSTSLGYNSVMLVCGWWGIIGLFLAPTYFVMNFYHLGRMLTGPRQSAQAPD